MVRVINEEPDKSIVREVICKDCGVTLEYVPLDIKSHRYKDISQVTETIKFIECPRCNQKVVIN